MYCIVSSIVVYNDEGEQEVVQNSLNPQVFQGRITLHYLFLDRRVFP